MAIYKRDQGIELVYRQLQFSGFSGTWTRDLQISSPNRSATLPAKVKSKTFTTVFILHRILGLIIYHVFKFCGISLLLLHYKHSWNFYTDPIVLMSPIFQTSLLSDCLFLCSSRDLVTKSREVLLAELETNSTIDRQMLVLQELIKRDGEDFQTREGTLKDRLNLLYQRAAYDKKWSAVRRGAGMLKKLVDSLAPGITTILVSGKVVSNTSTTEVPLSDHISKHQEDS